MTGQGFAIQMTEIRVNQRWNCENTGHDCGISKLTLLHHFFSKKIRLRTKKNHAYLNLGDRVQNQPAAGKVILSIFEKSRLNMTKQNIDW